MLNAANNTIIILRFVSFNLKCLMPTKWSNILKQLRAKFQTVMVPCSRFI